MDIRDLTALEKKLAGMPLDAPPVILVSGSDGEAFEPVLQRIKDRLNREVGSVETAVFGGEPGDDLRLREAVFNMSLFGGYRLFIVRQGAEVLKAALGTKGDRERFQAGLPPSTLLVIHYEGAPGAQIVKSFGDRLVHYVTRDLYGNQLADSINATIKRHGLKLDEEALYVLRESVEHKAGAIETAVARLVGFQSDAGGRALKAADVRELLLPNVGFNPFATVDALFARDFPAFETQVTRYNAATDNLFVVLKLILNRADEIRKAALAREAGMGDNDLLGLLNLKHRPPFIQKKTLQRLKREVAHYGPQRLGRIYSELIEVQKDFRGTVPPARHLMVFVERIGGVILA